MIGITGYRKSFANDVQRNNLGLNTNHVLDMMESNTQSITNKFYHYSFTTRNKCSSNLLCLGDNRNVAQKDSTSAFFDDHDAHNHMHFQADVTFLEVPLEIIENKLDFPAILRNKPSRKPT